MGPRARGRETSDMTRRGHGYSTTHLLSCTLPPTGPGDPGGRHGHRGGGCPDDGRQQAGRRARGTSFGKGFVFVLFPFPAVPLRAVQGLSPIAGTTDYLHFASSFDPQTFLPPFLPATAHKRLRAGPELEK